MKEKRARATTYAVPRPKGHQEETRENNVKRGRKKKATLELRSRPRPLISFNIRVKKETLRFRIRWNRNHSEEDSGTGDQDDFTENLTNHLMAALPEYPITIDTVKKWIERHSWIKVRDSVPPGKTGQALYDKIMRESTEDAGGNASPDTDGTEDRNVTLVQTTIPEAFNDTNIEIKRGTYSPVASTSDTSVTRKVIRKVPCIELCKETQYETGETPTSSPEFVSSGSDSNPVPPRRVLFGDELRLLLMSLIDFEPYGGRGGPGQSS